MIGIIRRFRAVDHACHRMVTAFQRLHATEKNIHVRPAIGITRLGSSRQFSLGSIAEAEGSGSDESKIAKDEDKVIRETNEAEIIAQLKSLCASKILELENMKRLRDEEVLKARKYAVDKFAKDIIVIADTLEYALKSASNSKLDPREGGNTLKILIDGLEMTYGKLVKVLEEHGVKRIASDGTKFDSDYHMAIYKVPDPSKTPGTILETRKAGYTLNGRVIRAAEVGVVSE